MTSKDIPSREARPVTVRERDGCLGQGCSRAGYCARHQFVEGVRPEFQWPRLCSNVDPNERPAPNNRRAFAHFERMRHGPSHTTLMQAEWLPLPREPIGVNSVFNLAAGVQ